MQPQKTKTILVAITSASAASRQRLRGIFRYSTRKSDWDLVLVRSPSDLTPQLLLDCKNGNIDGLILYSEECSDAILRAIPAGTPVLALGKNDTAAAKTHHELELTTDDAAIGEMAADYFKSLGRFASFAYVPDARRHSWSAIRGEAFIGALSASGRHVETYDSEKEAMPDFLSHLAKPAAVFAAYDYTAAGVLKACRQGGLAVPAQVAVLGVDNDDLICESVHPALSAIEVDWNRQGFVAAKIMDAMLKRGTPPPATGLVSHPVRVIARESTAAVKTGAALTERASRFIADHATEGIGVDDIADALHISRRLLDKRFAESDLGSVAGLIRKKKLAAVKRLLAATSLSDARIAMQCGFSCAGSLRNLFRATFGMSMSVYRRSKRTRLDKQSGTTA